ncbi:MAG: histidine phosphatase family protein [Candidatus Diapherotrites archaeon]
MPVRVSIRRHSHRPKESVGKEVGITRWGKFAAALRGLSLRSKGTQPKIYSSPYRRTRETGQIITKASGTGYRFRERKELGFDLLRSPEHREAARQYQIHGEKVFLEKWLTNQVDSRLFLTPREVATRLAKAMRKAQKGSTKQERVGRTETIDLEGISHLPHIMALFYELSRKRYSPNDLLKFNQAFQIEFGRQIILSYKGKKYDVTERFNELVGL